MKVWLPISLARTFYREVIISKNPRNLYSSGGLSLRQDELRLLPRGQCADPFAGEDGESTMSSKKMEKE